MTSSTGRVWPETIGDPQEENLDLISDSIERAAHANENRCLKPISAKASHLSVCATGFLLGLMFYAVAAPQLASKGDSQIGLRDATLPLTSAAVFGRKALCNTTFVSNSFSRQAIEETEQQLDWWMLHLDQKLESYRDNKSAARASHASFEAILPPEGPACLEKLSMFGKTHDTQKPICNVGDKLFKDGNCDILSFGSNNQWDTEIEIHKMTRCRSHTFDCTSSASQPNNIRDRAFFYKLCIGDHNYKDAAGLEYVTWTTALKRAGMTGSPDYLKMDIEGFEFQVLRNLIYDGHLLPDQIALEIHQLTFPPGSGNPASFLSWAGRTKDLDELLSFFLMLYEKGFRLSFVDHDTVCGTCLEVLLSRVYC